MLALCHASNSQVLIHQRARGGLIGQVLGNQGFMKSYSRCDSRCHKLSHISVPVVIKSWLQASNTHPKVLPILINHVFINAFQCHKSCHLLGVVDLRLSVSLFVDPNSIAVAKSSLRSVSRSLRLQTPAPYQVTQPLRQIYNSNLPIFTDCRASKGQKLVELSIQIVNDIHHVSSKCGMYPLWVQAPLLTTQ